MTAEPQDILAPSDWITADEAAVPEEGERPAYVFRRQFHLADPVEHADLTITAHGIYEAFLNGVRVGDEELTPSLSSYRRRLYAQTHDVGHLLQHGSNELRLVVSDGWFRGRCGPRRRSDNFGDEIAVLARLTGSVDLRTDLNWEWSRSEIVIADLMDGQFSDLRRIGAEVWRPVVAARSPLTADRARLARSPAPPVRRTRELAAKDAWQLPNGRWLLDFGQNINGWTRLHHLGPRGTRTVLTHAEALSPDRDITVAHLQFPRPPGLPPFPLGQVDAVISRGIADDVFEPRHTTHGFRYVAIDGAPASFAPHDATAVEVRTDLTRTGTFSTSDARIDRLHEVAYLTWRANTCDVPTDCPQRERWGYTGDYQVFVRSATHLEDVTGFSAKWLAALSDDQRPDGTVRNVAPMCGVFDDDPDRPIFFDGAAGWGDASAIVPWELYRAYGDPAVLAQTFPMMTRWVDYCARQAAEQRHPRRARARPIPGPHEQWLRDAGWQFGEWLEPGARFDFTEDQAIVATAYLHRSARIAADAATVLGDIDAEARYRKIADNARAAWQAEFLLPGGRLRLPSQANYARALSFGLIPGQEQSAAVDELVALIEANGNRLSTGFLSTALLLPVLSDHGRSDVAYRLLYQSAEPSWLAMIDRQATTIWERWDGIDSEGVPHDSLNHYAKGAVVEFLHEHAAGIRPLTPGYKRFQVAPRPDPRLGSVNARQITRYGEIAVMWDLNESDFALTVTVPSGTTCAVHLPDHTVVEVEPGTHSFRAVYTTPALRVTSRPPTGSPEPPYRAGSVRDLDGITLGELLEIPAAAERLRRTVPTLVNSTVPRETPITQIFKAAESRIDIPTAVTLQTDLIRELTDAARLEP